MVIATKQITWQGFTRALGTFTREGGSGGDAEVWNFRNMETNFWVP
jgi:hypothetical protein